MTITVFVFSPAEASVVSLHDKSQPIQDTEQHGGSDASTTATVREDEEDEEETEEHFS